MADIRCPMCGKLNPPDLEICQFCQARLVPLAPGAPLFDPGPAREVPEGPAEQGGEGEGWLDDLRGEGEEEDYPALDAEELETDSQDWLGRIRSDEPAWTPEPDATAAAEPEPELDWNEPAAPEEHFDAPDLAAMAFSGQDEAAEEDLPDWLRSIEAGPSAGADLPAASPPGASPPGSEEASGGYETLEIPGLAFRSGREDQPVGTPDSGASLEDDFLAEPGQLPDWLSEPAASPGVLGSSEEASDWLQDDHDASPGELPDWLQGEERPVPAQPSEEPLMMAGAAAAGVPDWLQDEPEPGSGELPDWLRDEGPGSDQPAGEALAMPAEIADFTGDEPDASPGELPDWLSEEPQAEPGGLPDWLEAGAAAAAFGAAAGVDTGVDTGDENEVESGAEPLLGGFAESSESEPPDWLQDEPLVVPGELPETPPVVAGEQIEDLPDWLEAETASAPPAEPAGLAEPGPESPDWLMDESEAEAGELPDWLKAGAAAEMATEPIAAAEDPTESDDWLQEGEEQDSGELPDWLKAGAAAAALGAVAGAFTSEEDEAETPFGASAEGEAGALPDWLQEGREGEPWDLERETPQAEAEGMLAQGAGEQAGWMENAEGPLDTSLPLSLEEEDVPDWLKSLQTAQEEASMGPPVEGIDSLEAAPGDPAEMVEEGQIPGWLEELSFAVPAIAVETEGAGQFPDLESPSEAAGGQHPYAGEAEIEPILPGVLQDAFAESEEMGTPAAEAEGDEELAPADLPAWLKAMRPVEAVAAVSPFIGEGGAGLSIEGAGPLAGLQGVLPAEPGAAQSRSSAMGSMRVDVTKSQYDHVALMKSIVKEEVEPRQYEEKRPLLQPGHILRWVIAAALIAFLLLPLLTGGAGTTQPVLVPPVLVPDETLAANQAISALEPGQKVLVSFDYQPGLSGEMDAITAPIFQDLLTRQALLTLVSTSPTGPALAESFLTARGLAEDFSLIHGQNYLNLGYIPGGAAGLQFFALNPQALLTVPFNLSGFTENPYGAWSSPPLQGISSLSNYALALVITDDAGVARAWVEQVGSSLGGTPLIVAASGQAAPLVRPYFDTVPPQVDGLVSGLVGGISYQQFTPASTLAGTYWEAYNNGILVAIVLIIAGGFYGTLASLWRRRKEEAEAKPAADKTEPEAEAGAES